MTTIDDPQPVGAPAPGGNLIATLGGKYYYDTAIFEAEQSRIFEQMWFCAARTADLATAGAFRKVQIGSESVLLVRGKDGALNAFLNVCRHRGAMLCTEEFGVVKRHLRCPYHAWTYNLDGKLFAAPNLGTLTDSAGNRIDRTEYGLQPLPLREWLGYAWVCLAADPPSFETDVIGAVTERLGGPEAIEHYDVADLVVGRRIVYDVAANWKLIVENFMECYHCL